MRSKHNITPAALVARANGDMDNLLSATTPGGIERQEAEGQTAFAAADSLPVDMSRVKIADLEALGFVFGEKIDDIFVKCKLPEGWSKCPTEHSMWTDLVDGAGEVRAAIFYKAAYYDRSARLNWNKDGK